MTAHSFIITHSITITLLTSTGATLGVVDKPGLAAISIHAIAVSIPA
jgi:hypothetical protein